MKYYFLLICIWMCSGCQGQSPKTEKQPQPPHTFRQATVPTLITDPMERADYLANHYWDYFDFQDTSYLQSPQIVEQALSDYIDLLKYVPQETVDASLTAMMKKAGTHLSMLTYFYELYEKYLYDPLSPFRNDEFFIPVLKALLANPLLEEADKIRPAYLLEQALKNRIGQPATDFTYVRVDDRKGTLKTLTADCLLVFFYNPDCHSCAETTQQLAADPLINQLIGQKRLVLLAIYPDADLELWRSHLSDIPSSWINAYSQSVKEEELYDLKAIPTLYLLDKSKKILLKDATVEQLQDVLISYIN